MHRESCPTCGALPARQMFTVVRVSENANALIKAHETACMEMATASGTDDALTAYAHLEVCRQSLYEYFAELEKGKRIERTTIKRF